MRLITLASLALHPDNPNRSFFVLEYEVEGDFIIANDTFYDIWDFQKGLVGLVGFKTK